MLADRVIGTGDLDDAIGHRVSEGQSGKAVPNIGRPLMEVARVASS
jgi:hypothetical protein